jgi:hypothetical protein
MSELIEFVVTIGNRDDVDPFYNEMAAGVGSPFIPARIAEVANVREHSRNTHYWLTNEEAIELRKDPRVVAVMPAELERIVIKPAYIQSGNFDKSTSNTNTNINWALLRCTEGSQRSNWGSNGTSNQNTSVTINLSGTNVDVVIIDGHIDPAHPEYAANADGTGGSRVNQLNWFTLNLAAGAIDTDGAALLTGNYVYTPYSSADADLTADNNHGAHVAGTVAGNTNGWARSANIYNISPYGTNSNSLDSLAMWDYIRAFHKNKSVNPQTGRRNPTICNCSYGSAITWDGNGSFGKVTRAIRRGVDSGTVALGLSNAQLIAAGIYDSGAATPNIPYYSEAVAADIQDAIADGVIVVAAAGNEYFNVDVAGGLDYNNTFYAEYNGTNYVWNQNRGTTPAAVPGVICVGNVSQFINESKRTSSNCGTRVDVYAPGSNIMSSFNTSSSFGGNADSRNASYTVGKISGTSMASPQVCGVLACALEMYPGMTPAMALDYIKTNAKTGQLTDTGGGAGDTTSLQGSANRYLFYYRERESTGTMFPKINYLHRPVSGQAFPRQRRRFYSK